MNLEDITPPTAPIILRQHALGKGEKENRVKGKRAKEQSASEEFTLREAELRGTTDYTKTDKDKMGVGREVATKGRTAINRRGEPGAAA